MHNLATDITLAQTFWPVKSNETNSIDGTLHSMIHHKYYRSKKSNLIVSYSKEGEGHYGVSQSRRVLSPQLLLKKFDYVRDCLKFVLGLSVAQREVVLRLLRLWAYYGQVYPKEALITEEPGCSKATFWRTIRLLEGMKLITRINRYVLRPHAQISNLYRLDKLIIIIARYLCNHIAHIWPDWLDPYLSMTWPRLWNWLVIDTYPSG